MIEVVESMPSKCKTLSSKHQSLPPQKKEVIYMKTPLTFKSYKKLH
jgi:hypothetical protein